MNILILGPQKRNLSISRCLEQKSVEYTIIQDLGLLETHEISNFTHLISSGYHKKIPISVLELFKPTFRINIHASYLPFGKGIGTILFAILYPVTLGSSIHVLDPEIDQGDILLQSKLNIPDDVLTQRTLHSYWVDHASSLFIDNIDCLLAGAIKPEKCKSNYSSPYLSRDDSEFHLALLDKGWDTSLEQLRWISFSLSLRFASLAFTEY